MTPRAGRKAQAAHDGLADLIERFDHVSMAVWDIASTLGMVEALGGEFAGGGDVSDFRWAQWVLPGGDAKIELVQPHDPEAADHFLVRFLAERGPGWHHVTFKVRDLAAAVRRAREIGFEVVGVDDEGPWKEAFLHPRSTGGVLVQLAQWTERTGPTPTLDEVLAGGVDGTV
jgi:methylmalonyl-CoA/ethylmalonyl-CoA epimerase